MRINNLLHVTTRQAFVYFIYVQFSLIKMNDKKPFILFDIELFCLLVYP